MTLKQMPIIICSLPFLSSLYSYANFFNFFTIELPKLNNCIECNTIIFKNKDIFISFEISSEIHSINKFDEIEKYKKENGFFEFDQKSFDYYPAIILTDSSARQLVEISFEYFRNEASLQGLATKNYLSYIFSFETNFNELKSHLGTFHGQKLIFSELFWYLFRNPLFFYQTNSLTFSMLKTVFISQSSKIIYLIRYKQIINKSWLMRLKIYQSNFTESSCFSNIKMFSTHQIDKIKNYS